MQRLSSTSTGFYKRVFPVLWIGFLGIFFGFSLWARWHPQAMKGPPMDVTFLWMPLLMAGIGVVFYRRFISDLMDEVWLDGDGLVIKNRAEKRRIALADVVNVNATISTNPRRITLMLRTETRFGSEVSFVPATTLGFLRLFKLDPIALDLIKRVDAARQAAR